MKLVSVRLSCALALGALLLVWSGSARAALIISNIQLTTDSLSFDLAGTIDVVGMNAPELLFIGEAGNPAWNSGFVAGSVTTHGGTYQPTGGDVNHGATIGSYAVLHGGGAASVGDTIDLSFSTTEVGAFDPSATDVSKWVISAGYNTLPVPDPTAVTGSAAPEPGSLAVLGLAGLIVTRRRMRR